jgi:hypothetical protein
MAFMKHAYAHVVSPKLDNRGWGRIRTASGSPAAAVTEQATEILGKSFNPEDHLLTHATIVCSVDAVEVPGVKTGAVEEDGQKVVRTYTDYRIQPTCDKFINNNLDAWSRDVLVKSYRTFIGAHNFVEHVQIEELSKGRVIDAVARDIGDSVYIDILIATDRKHVDLVAAIESGEMSTMSMGCSVDFTICTKCGHVAADETEMCKHVKYEKGNFFHDDQGQKHRVAELCGHSALDPTGGVQFIEASWVATPAFTGAVMRNIIKPQDMSERAAAMAEQVLSTPPSAWVDPLGLAKAAGIEAGWGDEEEEAAPAAAAPAKGPFDDLEDEVVAKILERAQARLKKDLAKGDDEAALSPETSTSAPNNNIVKEGVGKHAYLSGLGAIVATSSSDADLVNRVATFNESSGVHIPVGIYRAALYAGRTGQYSDFKGFLGVCEKALGRRPTSVESMTLIRLGRLISQRMDHL